MGIESYQHPALTVDVVLFALGERALNVLLVQRGKPPFEGAWAFPGGFVHVGESPQEAASRELEEETGIRDVHLEQLRVFGDPERDPRGHVVSVAFLALSATETRPCAKAGSDAGRARWWSIEELPPLAFDHGDILAYALRRLRDKLDCSLLERGTQCDLSENLSLGGLRAACRAITQRLEGTY